MAGEVAAYFETLKAWRAAEGRLRQEADPARRRVLAERVSEWEGALEEAGREVKAAAAWGDAAARELLELVGREG